MHIRSVIAAVVAVDTDVAGACVAAEIVVAVVAAAVVVAARTGG